MHLRYVLLVVVATLATTSTLSAASVSTDQRLLRTTDTETGPVFMESKLEKALSNPKKTKKLYQSWYKKGVTAEEVSTGLGQNENRELNKTYKKLASGYATYVEEQDALETV